MFKTLNLKKLGISLLVTFGAAALGYFFSRDAMQDYANLAQPPLAPPSWVFSVIWPILYLLMSIALYMVANSKAPQQQKSLGYTLYGIQLVFNFLWTLFFFVFGLYTFSAVWLVALILIVAANIFVFWRVNSTAGKLMLPYIIWLLFALYLNIGIAILN